MKTLALLAKDVAPVIETWLPMQQSAFCSFITNWLIDANRQTPWLVTDLTFNGRDTLTFADGTRIVVQASRARLTIHLPEAPKESQA